MDGASNTGSYFPSRDADGYGSNAHRPKVRQFGQESTPSQPGYGPSRQEPLFQLGILQIAGILLIIVFILALLSAVVIAMFDIHLLALTEFQDDGKSDVYGTVTDQDGQTLENVTVIIHGTHHFTKTNLDGFYSIENVKDGDYNIETGKEGYGNVTMRVSLNANIPRSYDFNLDKGGSDSTTNEQYKSNLGELKHLNYATANAIIVFGVIALIGGIFSFFQRFYHIAMLGGLCGLVAGVFSIGIIVGPIISVIALMLIVSNQEEFLTLEPSLIDRLRGLYRPQSEATARATPFPKAQGQKLPMRAAPTKPKFKAAKPQYYDRGAHPAPMPMPYEQPRSMERAVQKAPPQLREPSLSCVLCKGTVKAESHGTICQCGASYHKFCAGKISECRECGAPF